MQIVEKMKKIVSIVALLSLCMGSIAQERAETGKRWSLKECMIYALENSPRMDIQSSKNDIRRIDKREAALSFLPSVSGSSYAYTNFGRSIDPETNTYTNTTSFNNSYSIGAELTLFNGFSIVNNYRINKIARLSGVEESKQLENDICLNIIQAYYNLLYAQGMAKAAGEQLSQSRETLRQTIIQEELGIKSHTDLLQVEALVASDDFNYIRQTNIYKQALITLKEIMFFPNDQELTVEEINPEIILNMEGISSQELYDIAVSHLPKVRLAENSVRSAKLELQTSKFRLLPSIYAAGGYSTGYISLIGANTTPTPFWDQLKNRQGQYVQVGISIPIFNSLTRHNTIARKKNSLNIAENEKKQVIKEVENEIQRAIQDMNGAHKEFVQADKRFSAQQAAHKANQKRYEEGLISVLELQTSSNQYLISQAERLNSAFTYLIKKRVVEYYKGTPYLLQIGDGGNL